MFFLCLTHCLASLIANPFTIEFPKKKELTVSDYIEIQNQLRAIDLEPLLEKIYPHSQGYAEFGDFLSRISRGIRQTLIDPKNPSMPAINLVKINEGGPYCIVTCVPHSENYTKLIDAIPAALQKTNFNGYFLYMMGGFPNPTGMEIQYVGVPYSFKIFMMLEAYNRGFEQILWIDSAMLPLNNPTPLFDEIKRSGALFVGWGAPSYLWGYILPETRYELLQLTGTDVLSSFYVCTRMFGLNLSSSLSWEFIQKYKKFVKRGTPFLSCFPEEFVFTALAGQPEYASWPRHYFQYLLRESRENDNLDEIKTSGVFFYQRQH